VPLRSLPVSAVREIVGPGTLVVYDASHTLGLIAGGVFQDPLSEGCDVLQGNTHKSFPGAHKGLIAYRDRTLGERAAAAFGSALVSSQNTAATLANFVTALEMAEHADAYAAAMQTNRVALAAALSSLDGRFLGPADSGPVSCSHVLLVESVAGRRGYDLARDLIAAGLHLNARPVNGRVVLRLGVQEVTRLGMGPTQMHQLAELIVRAAADDPHVRGEVVRLRRRHRHVAYSLDTQLVEVTS
jgi:glycine hydroxymethyltransferase